MTTFADHVARIMPRYTPLPIQDQVRYRPEEIEGGVIFHPSKLFAVSRHGNCPIILEGRGSSTKWVCQSCGRPLNQECQP